MIQQPTTRKEKKVTTMNDFVSRLGLLFYACRNVRVKSGCLYLRLLCFTKLLYPSFPCLPYVCYFGLRRQIGGAPHIINLRILHNIVSIIITFLYRISAKMPGSLVSEVILLHLFLNNDILIDWLSFSVWSIVHTF